MTRLLTLLCLAALALSAAPVEAQVGDRFRRAAERAVDRATGRDDARSGRRLSDGPSQMEASRAREAAERAALEADPERREAIALARELVEVYTAEPDADAPRYDGQFLSDGPDALAEIEAAEARLEALDAVLARMIERWGVGDSDDPADNLRDAFSRMEIDEAEYSETNGLHHVLMMTASLREETAARRTDLARFQLPTVQGVVRDLAESTDIVPENIEQAALYADRAALLHRIDPTNAEVEAFMAEAAAVAGGLEARLREQIAAGRWPGHAAGAPSGLAPGIVGYLRTHPSWSSDGERVLAVAVRGGWTPHKHNLAGQVIQWALPVVIASSKPAWDAWGGARMFGGSVLSQEGLPSAKGAPYGGVMVGLASGWIEPGRVPR